MSQATGLEHNQTEQEFQALWEQQDEETQSLLADVLEDKDVVFRVKVLNLVVKHGLSSSDPVFLFLIAVGNLQVMLEEAPSALALSLEKVRRESQKAAADAVANNQALIAQSVRELIGKTEALQLKRPSKVLIPGLSLFAIVFSLGLISGTAVSFSLRQLASSGVRIATLSEAATLEWANSSEGQFARSLYEWNKPYLDSGQCINDMAQIGVKLNVGQRKAVKGFCALWIVPPARRQYQP